MHTAQVMGGHTSARTPSAPGHSYHSKPKYVYKTHNGYVTYSSPLKSTAPKYSSSYSSPKAYGSPTSKGGYYTKGKLITRLPPKKNTGYITYASKPKATPIYVTSSSKPSLSTSKYGTYVIPSSRSSIGSPIGTPVAITSSLGSGSRSNYYK